MQASSHSVPRVREWIFGVREAQPVSRDPSLSAATGGTDDALEMDDIDYPNLCDSGIASSTSTCSSACDSDADDEPPRPRSVRFLDAPTATFIVPSTCPARGCDDPLPVRLTYHDVAEVMALRALIRRQHALIVGDCTACAHPHCAPPSIAQYAGPEHAVPSLEALELL